MSSPGGRHSGGGLRGKSTFSKAARRRLFAFLLSIETKPDYFITLTYPDTFDAPWEESFRHLTILIKRLRRRFPSSALFWKREYTEAGVCHFHLIVWGMSLSGHYEEFSRFWWESTGCLSQDHLKSGTKIEPPKGNWHYYLAKYVSKPVEGHTGRYWGIYGRSALSYYPVEVLDLDYSFYHHLQFALSGLRFGKNSVDLFNNLQEIVNELRYQYG